MTIITSVISAVIIISSELQNDRFSDYNTKYRDAFEFSFHCCLRQAPSLFQSESLSSSKFIPWANEETEFSCTIRNLAHTECRLDITIKLDEKSCTCAAHSLTNDVHRNRVRHLILNVHHRVVHVHVFPSCCFCLISAFGKRSQERKGK